MSIVSENLRFLRKKAGYTQQTFASALNIKRSLIGAYEEGRAEVRLHLLADMARLLDITLDDLIARDVKRSSFIKSRLIIEKDSQAGFTSMQTPIIQEYPTAAQRITKHTTPVSNQGNIPFVPAHQFQRFLNSLSGKESFHYLSRFHVPKMSSQNLIAFEIEDSSMPPSQAGDIILCREVDMNQISARMLCVFALSSKLIFRRLIKVESDYLFVVADSKNYEPSNILIRSMQKCWKAEGLITFSLPQTEDQQKLALDKLANVVINLQQEIIKLKQPY